MGTCPDIGHCGFRYLCFMMNNTDQLFLHVGSKLTFFHCCEDCCDFISPVT